MPDTPENTPKPPESNNNNHDDIDILSRLREAPKPLPRYQPKPPPPPEEPEEDFWAAFSMMTHTGERFTINVCFRSKKHYNTEMHKFETAKNAHIVLTDANGESVVIKREILLHVLPQGTEESIEKRKW